MRYLLFTLAAATLFAQQPQAPDATEMAHIEGVVVSTTGAPVPGAQVVLERPAYTDSGTTKPPFTTAVVANDEGKFTIKDIPPGQYYRLTSKKRTFSDGHFGARSNSGVQSVFTITAGQALTGLTITMAAQSVLSGVVTDTAKEPVLGARVMLGRRVYQRGAWQLDAVSSVTTNDLGEFRLPNVLPGRYTLVVSDGHNQDQSLPKSKKLTAPTFFPGTTDFNAAAYIEVAGGQDIGGIQLRLLENEVFTVRGTLVGDPELTGQVLVLVTPHTEFNNNIEPRASALTQLNRLNVQARNRSFELRNLHPGEYVVQAVATGPPLRSLGSSLLTIADKDIGDKEGMEWVFPISAPLQVTGTLSLEGDRDGSALKKLFPLQTDKAKDPTADNGVPIPTGKRPSGLSLVLGEIATVTELPHPGPVLEDGTFMIENLAPGSHMVYLATLPVGTYVKSARTGGSDITQNYADLVKGTTIDILLSDKAASVEGTVVDEKGASPPAIAVSVWPQDADLNLSNQGTRVTIADQNGHFAFQNLRPGVYYAVAFEDTEWGLARERAYLNSLIPDATRFNLKENEQGSKQIKIVPIPKLKALEEKLR